MAFLTKTKGAETAPNGSEGSLDDVMGDAKPKTTYQWPDPAKPSAMLVPPYIRHKRANEKTYRTMSVTVLSTVALVVLASIASAGLALQSSSNLDTAKADQAKAQIQIDKYAEVAAYYDGLTARQTSLEEKLSGDISYYDLASKVIGAIPSGIKMNSLETMPGAPCPGPNPFVSESVQGCIKVSGKAVDTTTVGDFVASLAALSESSALVEPFVSALSSQTGGDMNFQVSINYTPDALTNRFVPEKVEPVDPNAAPVPAETTTTTDEGVSQ